MYTRRQILLAGVTVLAAPSLNAQGRIMELKPDWEFVADTVMGGVSRGEVSLEAISGRPATRLQGDVSLENNGGFVQMAFDLANGKAFDASGFEGVEFECFGNDETYDIRLRTDELQRPWHSYRATFQAEPTWTTKRIPFDEIAPHKTDIPFNPQRLRRIGIVAIGREFRADIAVSRVALY